LRRISLQARWDPRVSAVSCNSPECKQVNGNAATVYTIVQIKAYKNYG